MTDLSTNKLYTNQKPKTAQIIFYTLAMYNFLLLSNTQIIKVPATMLFVVTYMPFKKQLSF